MVVHAIMWQTISVYFAVMLTTFAAFSHSQQSLGLNELLSQTSPPKYPTPWMSGTGEWAEAYKKAKTFVSQLTLLEKVNLTTGVGYGFFLTANKVLADTGADGEAVAVSEILVLFLA